MAAANPFRLVRVLPRRVRWIIVCAVLLVAAGIVFATAPSGIVDLVAIIALASAATAGLLLVAPSLLARPSSDRDWQVSVSRIATVEITGDTATIHNVRDFRYRSTDDFDARWETRAYDLAAIRSVDLVLSYWGHKAIAHTILSFGFEDGRHLAVSVEVRRPVGERYSPVRSFFKRFELIYVLADERDVIQLRTSYRCEHVYLFPMGAPPERARLLFEDVMARVNALADEPEFYRTIRDNCTTALYRHYRVVTDNPVRFGVRLLLNGLLPALIYSRGRLPQDAPLEEVKQRFAISERARAIGDGPGFSDGIRDGLGRPRSTVGRNRAQGAGEDTGNG